jgi:23S rRNA (guanosine2251-2'-O)-methyltransferase
MTDTDSSGYLEKKGFFQRMITVYGRKPVLAALADESLSCYALHLADSNRDGGIVADIQQRARSRGVDIQHHSRAELSRLSKNGKQDQGVALDIQCPGFTSIDQFLAGLQQGSKLRLLALDGITNPQNLGMIIRSAVAGGIDGILWSKKGNAALGPLVIKASVGTVYRAPLVLCQDLATALSGCRDAGMDVCTLAADATDSVFEWQPQGHVVYVLGNETDGVSAAVQSLASQRLAIPMSNKVESLNVAVAASLIAFAGSLKPAQ